MQKGEPYLPVADSVLAKRLNGGPELQNQQTTAPPCPPFQNNKDQRFLAAAYKEGRLFRVACHFSPHIKNKVKHLTEQGT